MLVMNFSDSRDFERSIVKIREWYQAVRVRAAPTRGAAALNSILTNRYARGF